MAMFLGISLGSRHTKEDVARFVREGFRYFELSIPANIGKRGQEEKYIENFVEPLMEGLREAKVCPWSFHLPFGAGFDIAAYDEAERREVVASLKRLMTLLKDYGARVFVIHGCLEPVEDAQRPVRMAYSIASLSELEAHAKSFGMRIALENLPRSCLANDAKETLAMLRAAGHIGVCFDVNHLLNDTHERFLDEIAPFIVTTHLSDYDGIDERHWLPGEGIVPWKTVVERLEKAGYRGPYLFELSRGENGEYAPQEIKDAFYGALER
ncbi:MAG: sugar phosphate isomerase/epimerase family protein [Christensenellales bacterium]|jgi:sugar phosphate isomerase/epimerase